MISKCKTAGFTLVELLIVVVILAILAAVAIPQFTSSAEDAKASALQANLGVLRSSMELYKLQHNGKFPGFPSAGGDPTTAEFSAQMLTSSKVDGSTAAAGTAGYAFGPYVKEQIPVNPANGLNTVTVLKDADAFPASADGASGWVYKPSIGKIRPNATGNAPSGDSWFSF
jgi:general secretion pathway protein G